MDLASFPYYCIITEEATLNNMNLTVNCCQQIRYDLTIIVVLNNEGVGRKTRIMKEHGCLSKTFLQVLFFMPENSLTIRYHHHVKYCLRCNEHKHHFPPKCPGCCNISQLPLFSIQDAPFLGGGSIP